METGSCVSSIWGSRLMCVGRSLAQHPYAFLITLSSLMRSTRVTQCKERKWRKRENHLKVKVQVSVPFASMKQKVLSHCVCCVFPMSSHFLNYFSTRVVDEETRETCSRKKMFDLATTMCVWMMMMTVMLWCWCCYRLFSARFLWEARVWNAVIRIRISKPSRNAVTLFVCVYHEEMISSAWWLLPAASPPPSSSPSFPESCMQAACITSLSPCDHLISSLSLSCLAPSDSPSDASCLSLLLFTQNKITKKRGKKVARKREARNKFGKEMLHCITCYPCSILSATVCYPVTQLYLPPVPASFPSLLSSPTVPVFFTESIDDADSSYLHTRICFRPA